MLEYSSSIQCTIQDDMFIMIIFVLSQCLLGDANFNMHTTVGGFIQSSVGRLSLNSSLMLSRDYSNVFVGLFPGL